MTPPPILRLALLATGLVCVSLWAAFGGVWHGAALVLAGVALALQLQVGQGARDGAPASGLHHRGMLASSALLLMAALAALAGDAHLDRVSADWEDRAQRWESGIEEELGRELDELLAAGERSASRLVRHMEDWDGGPVEALPSDLRPSAIDAVAIFEPGGQPVAWDGSHQGPVPRSVRLGLAPYIYAESALFGYLYVIRPLPEGRGTAMAVSLLRADLPTPLEDLKGDFVSRFQERTGARIEITRAERESGASVWDLTWDGDILFSVLLDPASEAVVRDRLRTRWLAVVAFLLLAGWFLLARSARGRPGHRAMAAAALPPVLVLLPLGTFLPWPRLFAPEDFLLPGPLPLTLGHLLLLGVAGILLLAYLPVDRLRRLGPPLAGALAVLPLWGLLHLMDSAASADFLAAADPFWVTFTGTVLLLACLPLAPALVAARRRAPGPAWPPLAAGLGLALLMAAVLAWVIRQGIGTPPWLAVFWAGPLLLVAAGLGPDPRWRIGVLRWVAVSAVAASLVLPWSWSERIEARTTWAQERIERLGTASDPFLEFLLLRAGEEAQRLALTGREPVDLLYSTWTSSGMAREGRPLWLTLWDPTGRPNEELRIGVAGPRPPVPIEVLLEAGATGGVAVRRQEAADAHYVMAAPLADGGAVSAVVPPRRVVAVDAPLGPLFSPARTEPDPLRLIPLLSGRPDPVQTEVRWTPTSGGRQADFLVEFPEQVYQGHYLVEIAGGLVVLARGVLLLLAGTGLILLLWASGRRLSVGGADGPRRLLATLASFRGRVTLALFGFFLLPTVLFGALAWQTLSGASVRTAEALAIRAVEDAGSWFYDVEGALDLLASRVGSDLLLYDSGRLVGGSARELVELGLYEGWMPPELHRSLAAGDALSGTTLATLGGWEYVVAYLRIPGDFVLAAPAPLQAGALAVRQREIADLLGFALVVGAGLSVLLALGVGRALTRPIQTLQVASERVGSGNMGVHLPDDRTDEFGAVFGAFNRMVDRLSRTRRALVRSSRRTRAIVEEVATGVVALDPRGRVTLANPRAETLLGVRLPLNRPLPGNSLVEDPLRALAEWVATFLRDGLPEAGTEFQIGERRIRLRARRIARKGPPGGAVVALEDVTDELRTERILAWGEMAQQVAHEVKNPLTPIKLGVQHIRRAHRDRREDFDAILDRNVDAILREIDRLASIASSFSRYAAPGQGEGGPRPPAPVEVPVVVADIMDLYRAGEGPVEFHSRVPEDLPPVLARSDELKEVLVNLLENARAAMPGAGEVVITACTGADRVSSDSSSSRGTVELRVEDTGSGIPPEFMPRIFDPHFSTRSSGTGLGLAIVRRLVESWGGTVRASSRQGEGTEVILVLPVAGDPDGGGAAPPPET